MDPSICPLSCRCHRGPCRLVNWLVDRLEENCVQSLAKTPSSLITACLPSGPTAKAFDGIPPPIPSIRPNLINWKVLIMEVATVAAKLVPVFGRQAITTLWPRIEPKIYALWSLRGVGRGSCSSYSMALAAVCSFGRAHTHPIV